MTESQIDTTFFIEVGLEILGWVGTVLQDNNTIKPFSNNLSLFTFICFANECDKNKTTKGCDTNQTSTNKLCKELYGIILCIVNHTIVVCTVALLVILNKIRADSSLDNSSMCYYRQFIL